MLEAVLQFFAEVFFERVPDWVEDHFPMPFKVNNRFQLVLDILWVLIWLAVAGGIALLIVCLIRWGAARLLGV